MPVTMEDTVDFLLNSYQNFRLDQPRLSRKDFKLLTAIRGRSWKFFDYPALTERQQQLVQNIVSQYLMMLRVTGWPVEELANPVWQKPAKPNQIVHRTLEFDRVNQQIVFEFPYDQILINLMRELDNRHQFLGQLVWHADRYCWTALPTEQTLNLIRYLLATGEWYRDEQITELLKTQQVTQVPAVSYLNGEWQFLHMSAHLQGLCEQLVQNTDTVVSQAFDLLAHGVELRPPVQHLLRTWLAPSELELLMQTSRSMTPAGLPVLMSLIQKVNRWPLVLINNPYNLEQLPLENLNWPAGSQVHGYARPPQELTERVPWVICERSLYLTPAYEQLYHYADRWISVENVII